MWTHKATAALHGCFEYRDWHMFRDACHPVEPNYSLEIHNNKCINDMQSQRQKNPHTALMIGKMRILTKMIQMIGQVTWKQTTLPD